MLWNNKVKSQECSCEWQYNVIYALIVCLFVISSVARTLCMCVFRVVKRNILADRIYLLLVNFNSEATPFSYRCVRRIVQIDMNIWIRSISLRTMHTQYIRTRSICQANASIFIHTLRINRVKKKCTHPSGGILLHPTFLYNEIVLKRFAMLCAISTRNLHTTPALAHWLQAIRADTRQLFTRLNFILFFTLLPPPQL